MLEKLKANILFDKLLKRPDIDKAYKMVGPEDSWYDTITKVHNSLAEIRKLPHEIWHITSHDGLKLEAIYYPGTSDKTMIWGHGYTSHAERESAFPGLFYRSMGYSVLIPYQRAHGPSDGKYISFGALEHMDMILWAQRVNERNPDGQIVFHGLSMGGAVVLNLADKQIQNVACLVADAPNVSILDFFRNVSRNVFKGEYEKVYACALKRFQKEFHVDASDFEVIRIVKNSRYPILLSAGSNEKLEETLHLIKEANPNETDIIILPGCNHGNGMYKQTQMYQDAIRSFLDKYIVR